MFEQYVVLPAQGFRSPVFDQKVALRLTILLAAAVSGTASLTKNAMSKVEVIGSVIVDGPKLVEMTPETELEFRLDEPALKIVPLVTYEQMRGIYEVKRAAAKTVLARRGQGAALCIEHADENPLVGARVVAFTNFRTRAGDDGSTDANGEIRLQITSGVTLERICIYAPPRLGGLECTFTLTPGTSLQLERTDLAQQVVAGSTMEIIESC